MKRRSREALSLDDLRAMGSTNVVARDLWPAAFEAHAEWSGAVADARRKARRSAQDLREKDPLRFAEIVRDTMRRAELARLSAKQQ